MKNLILIFGTALFLSTAIGCSNSTNNNREEDSHAFDSTNTMHNDGMSIYDSLGRDTLRTDSLIPPTPIN